MGAAAWRRSGSAPPASSTSAGSTVRFSPHLSWRDEPLKAALESQLGVPVVVDNDANTTALAEMRFGAGRGYRQVLCVTLGTGIGGALVLDGDVFRGGNGMAGEFGHMQVMPGGRRCECGNRGLLGAVLQRQRAGPRGARAGRRGVAHRLPAAGPGRRRRLSPHRAGGHRGGAGG